MMRTAVSAGTIEYTDSGGNGPVLVFVHGLMMDASLWDETIAGLSANYRCLALTLPLGAHREPARRDADLSLAGIARAVEEFLTELDLRDVTLVGNDTGGAVVQVLMAQGAPRVTRAVLVSCDAFDNFPPGLTGKTLVFSAKLPPRMFGLVMEQMRLRPARRAPFAFGWLTKRGDAATARWVKPVLEQREIREDTVRLLRTLAASARAALGNAAEKLPGFDHPVLVAWAADDRVMPPEHGRRLAALVPQGQLTEIPDSYTLVPLDQPAKLAEAIHAFMTARAAT